MQPFKLCYCSAHSMEIPSLSAGIRKFRKNNGKIKITARSASQLFDKARINAFVKDALESDIVLIILHGGKASCPAFESLVNKIAENIEKGIKTPYLHIHPQGSDEDGLEAAKEYDSGFSTDTWSTINRYLIHGGPENFYNLFCFFHNILFEKEKIECKPPAGLPQEGIYHPDINGVMDVEQYIRKKVVPGRITVGIWFYQSYWLNGDLKYIDAVIRETERHNANVICVFHLRYKDSERGNRGADYAVEHFFMKNGKSLIDVLINPMLFSLTLSDPGYKHLLPLLNVPFIQAIVTLNSYELWKASDAGISPMEISYSIAQPEFDGALITVPIAAKEENDIDPVTGALMSKNMPIPDRVEKMVSLSLNWAKLSKKQNKDKKIAIIFHHYPPRNDRIGCAAGLDSFESVKHLLDEMKKNGYKIDKTYETGDELANKVLDRMTCDRRWLTMDKMAERAEAFAGKKLFLPWHNALPSSIKKKMTADWGEVPGELFVYKDKMHFAGFVNGNIFITIQPPRGYFENIEKIYHDMHLSPPHHYLAHYRWIKEVFKADAVMHVGKHGSLEWLPGKAAGLSQECYPDLAIMDLPNIYPYIINDPSEGTQAKRRSFCCIIDHLTPVFTNADLYEELADVENLLKEYTDAKTEDYGKIPVLKSMIWEAVCTADLDKDLETSKKDAFNDFDAFLEKLHSYLSDLGDTMINDGLHILGKAPENDRLAEFIVQLTRLENGDVPSLRESILNFFGYNYDELVNNKGKSLPGFNGKTGGQIIKEAHETGLAMVKQVIENMPDTTGHDTTGHDTTRHDTTGFVKDSAEYIKFNKNLVQKIISNSLLRMKNNSQSDQTETAEIMEVMRYICENLIPDIRQVTDEIDSGFKGFNGEFVLPGPSGAPTRGQADILPTGRNFFSVDPNKIPTPAAWKLGKKMGDVLIERYLEETGKYPDSIGIILWGGSVMRTRGDDIAEIYYLMGLKPIWAKGSGNVTGLEIIPASKLKRPRLDVVPRISGFFRDAFPNLVERIDEAAQMVAALNESFEINILRRNVLLDKQTYMEQGMDEEHALREATFRVFGCPPGTYGAGVSELIESKNWKTSDDLGNNYIRWSAHAYGRETYGKQKPAAFRNLLSRMDVTVKNEDSREYDMMSCTDYYNYYGGLIAAAKTVRGSLPFSLVGDSSDPKRVKIRTTFEEAKHVLRSRLTNPKWLKGMKRHGYKGAGDISHMMDVVLGWDATAEVIEDWMYKRIADKFALDPAMQEWMKDVNPYALENILNKLLEAISRGMWKADNETEKKLQQAYLEMEGEIEELTE